MEQTHDLTLPESKNKLPGCSNLSEELDDGSVDLNLLPNFHSESFMFNSMRQPEDQAKVPSESW